MTMPTKREIAAAQAANVMVTLLLESKQQRKGIGNPGMVRKTARERILATALRLAIAEEIFSHPKLYGADMAAAYQRRCREIFG